MSLGKSKVNKQKIQSFFLEIIKSSNVFAEEMVDVLDVAASKTKKPDAMMRRRFSATMRCQEKTVKQYFIWTLSEHHSDIDKISIGYPMHFLRLNFPESG